MDNRLEKYRKVLLILSWSTLIASLLSPDYCTNAHCALPGSGFIDLLFGAFAALFMGSTYFAWFANPFIFTAIFINKSAPILCLVFSIVALGIALTFLGGGKVLLNEAGQMGYITKLQLGYWLWISGMILMITSSVLSIMVKVKKRALRSENQVQ